MDSNSQAIQGASLQLQQQASPQATPASSPDLLKQAVNKKKQNPSLSEELAQGYDPASISQALAVVNPNGKDTTTRIGKSIQSPAYANYCLQWVDDQQGNTNRLPTAIADFQARAQAGDISSSDKIPSGSRVYFSANESNGGMGHVGIANSDGTFTSATDNGIKTYKISDWEKSTGQQMLGWSKSN